MNDEAFTAYLDKLNAADSATEPPIQAFVTNLGKYVEGELVGEWLALPTTTEQVQECFARIGLDGKQYEEMFITDYETQVAGLYDCLGEYSSLDELNYLAAQLSELDSGGLAKFEAAVELGNVGSSVKDLINLTDNLDDYDLYPDVNSEEDYGYYLIDECDALEIPDGIRNYFDYEAYGRDVMMEENGTITEQGYVIDHSGSFIEYYDGKEVPEEYRVSAYPDKDTYKRLAGQEKPEPVQER